MSCDFDRAEFLGDNCDKVHDGVVAERASARTPDAIVAMDLEAAELLQRLRKISDAVHTGNPAPHLRLVSDTE